MNRVDSARSRSCAPARSGWRPRARCAPPTRSSRSATASTSVAEAGDRGDPAGRLAPRRRGHRRRRRAGHRHGGHRSPAFPSLVRRSDRARPSAIYGMRELTRHPDAHAPADRATPPAGAPARRQRLHASATCSAARGRRASLDAGASVRQMRGALDGPARAQPRSRATAGRGAAGARRSVGSWPSPTALKFDPRTGQMVLDLDPPGLEAAAAATLRDRDGAAAGAARRAGRDLVRARQRVGRRSRRSGTTRSPPTGAWSSIDPTYAAAWNNLGLLLHRLGQYDEARDCYVAALEQDERCCEAVYNLGSLARGPRRPRGGGACYRLALELSPDYADAHFNLAGALARSGHADEARSCTGSATSSSTPAVRGPRIARAHLEVLEPPGRSQRPRQRRMTSPAGRRRRARARAGLEDRPEPAGRAAVGGARQPRHRAHARCVDLVGRRRGRPGRILRPARAASTSSWSGPRPRWWRASPTGCARPGSPSSGPARPRRRSRAPRRSPRS